VFARLQPVKRGYRSVEMDEVESAHGQVKACVTALGPEGLSPGSTGDSMREHDTLGEY